MGRRRRSLLLTQAQTGGELSLCVFCHSIPSLGKSGHINYHMNYNTLRELTLALSILSLVRSLQTRLSPGKLQ